MKKLEPSCIAGGKQNSTTTMENGLVILQKVKTESPYDPVFPLQSISKRTELRDSNIYLPTNVPSINIHNSQKVETTPSIHKPMNDKQCGIYIQ